ncbi:ribose-phosphate pyrophosphokinase [Candidatus Woesearchaeota archaeon]|nr:ribose-phosphate pyrophosphokinase [Candidatus Woesearchaeota archaeon]|tara:strand:+ start:8055 stop:9008 length:954 start_codon:yes stop_codon:yes gene_type:complete
MKGIKLIAGTASKELAKTVATRLGVTLVDADIGKFPNGEIRVELKESVRKQDIFIIQSTCPPVNDNLMELLILIDALKRASAGFITVIIPYFGYSKQDKKKTGREPISSKLVARMLEMVGVKRVVTFDLHATQIEGFFDIPVENLTAINMIADYFKKNNIKDTVIVAPDAGGVKRARDLANAMNANRLAIIDKYREDFTKATAMNVVGKVENMNAIIIDDFIDTGGSIVEAVKAVKNHNAAKIWVACTHPLFTEPATQRLKELDELEEVIVTDTIPLAKEKMFKKVRVLSTADIISDVIQRISGGKSLHQHRPNNKH